MGFYLEGGFELIVSYDNFCLSFETLSYFKVLAVLNEKWVKIIQA